MTQIRSFIRAFSKIEGVAVAGVLALLYVVFIMTSPEVFTKPRIYTSFMQTISPQLIIGLALTFVITAGEIDLSFPAVVALGGFMFVWAYNHIDGAMGPWIGLALALLVGAGIGWINGIMVAHLGVPSIMATLAAQFFWYGVTILVADGKSIALTGIRDEPIYEVFVGRIQGILPDQRGVPVGLPAQAVWALAMTIFMWFILNRHKFGEAVMFIGDNPDVARVMGINVEATRVQLFVMMGVMAAFAGVILTLDINVFFPTQGEGYLLPVMAAVFIGGTSIAGGVGVIVGTFFGAYIIGSLEAGVVASGISGYWVQLVKGLVMGASIILNILLGEGRIAGYSEKLRQWGVPMGGSSGSSYGGGNGGDRASIPEAPPPDAA
ncbi:MAG: ABC transporter permease [Anaerolineae bacterium]|nr:ABC transporter permease [Anaerolineae bacterium]